MRFGFDFLTSSTRGDARRCEEFIAANAPGGRVPPDWSVRIARAGYVAPHWPAPYGLDAGPAEQLAIDSVLRAGPPPQAVEPHRHRLGRSDPARRRHPEQQARWLPGILDGSELWCQLFSEPDAGSDLASLRTTATRDGDEYVVSGGKVWTTLAHVARYGILLARTDPTAEAHQGITYFVLDMRSPGVTVRPIVQMTGTHEFNEVVLDRVRVPAGNVVGTEHDGWRLAKVTLGNERVSLSGEGALWGRGPTTGDLLDLVRGGGGTADPHLRQRLAALHIESEILRLIRMRTVSARLRGLEPGPETSVRKALADVHGQHVMALGLELCGTDGLLADFAPYGDHAAGWAYGFLYSPALTIGGGTSEVQRTVIGEKILGPAALISGRTRWRSCS